MKKLKDYKEDYYYYTGKTSEINRSLAIAGIAIIWIFNKAIKTDVINLPPELVLPLILFFVSLGLDLFQYFIGGIIWYLFFRHYEKQGKDDDFQVLADKKLPGIIHIFYYLKVIANAIGFYFLIEYLISVT